MKVKGYFNDERYQIMLAADGSPVESCIYQAGNNRCDSQSYIARGSDRFVPPYVLSLEEMGAYCASTAKEMAAEHGFEYGGVEHDPNGEYMDLSIVMDWAHDIEEAKAAVTQR